MTNRETRLKHASHGAPHEKHFYHADLHDNSGVGTFLHRIASAKIKAEIQENIIAVGKAIEVLKAEPKSVAFTQTKKEAMMQMEQSTAMSSRQKEIVSLLVTGTFVSS